MAVNNYAEAWIDQYANELPTVNFVSGDYTSLKESIRQYVVKQCPEDYNDWANSSEVGIFVNGLSYLGSIINYRVDLNAHDIFPSTTERRSSLLNFVKMLSYSPKRNIAALGIAKIVSVKTTEMIYDSLGNSLKDITINWNDGANQNWLEQYLTVLNSAMNVNNPYGKPLKKMSLNGISTQLYQLNNTRNNSCIYPFTSVVNGSVRQFEVVNADLDTKLYTIEERTPVPEESFNILYRNDGFGNSSVNTGFFLYWKQGNLKNQILQFNERIENNTVSINEYNINNYDVWFQSIDSETGYVKENWVKVDPSEYLVYNDLDTEIRNIFKVESKEDDKILLKFSDGKFGTIPIGYFRVWYRISNGNEDMFIKPSDIRNVSITIPYKSANSSDGNTYNLTLEFSISDSSHITQSVAQESISYIRERAPQVYSTQNRMVTGSDYNYFPKSHTQRIKLLKAIERTYSGNSRYINFNDPTGTYEGLQLLGTDGYLYSQSGLTSVDVAIEEWYTKEELIEELEKQLRKLSLSNFYYENFKTEEAKYMSDNNIPYTYAWKTIYDYGTNSSVGYFEYNVLNGGTSIPYESVAEIIKPGMLLRMVTIKDDSEWDETSGVKPSDEDIDKESWVTVNGIIENTKFSSTDDHTQDITINDSLSLDNTWFLCEYYEPFIISINNIKEDLYSLFNDNTSFGLRYNKNKLSLEIVSYNALSNGDWEEQDDLVEIDNGCTDWLLMCRYNSSNQWTIKTRYLNYLFGSANDISFFFNTSIKNSNGTFYTDDYIKIMKNQSNDLLKLSHDYYWKPCNTIMYSDGYTDPLSFVVYGYDEDKDSTIDNPLQFKQIASESKQKLFFGKDNSDEYTVLYDNVTELNDMWEQIPDGKYKDYSATNVSGYYYIQTPCSIFTSGTSIPYKLNEDGTLEEIKIIIKKTVTLSDGSIVYASENNPSLVARSGQTYNYDVVYNNHIVKYEENNEGKNIITEDIEKEDEPTLIYWSSSDGDMEIYKEGIDYKIIEGVKDIVFLWKHYATTKYLIDPSTTNIIDMYVLTNQYWDEVQTWINAGKKDSFPQLPSEYELRSMFADLENYKMLSDSMIWHPISFKLLFGSQANEELRGLFKIIKNDNTILSDNEIKQEVVEAIDEFFSQMSAGETFYFTQLSSYIHKKLGNNINTPLLVPTYSNENFGDLFEIKCEPDEILLSCATIDDIQIISKITDYNIRIAQ